MSSANFKCIPLLNLLRFQGGELEERVFDAKFQDFMAAAKSDLEKAQTQKAKALIYHATISAQLAFLERKGFESAVMQGLALEVEGRVSGKQRAPQSSLAATKCCPPESAERAVPERASHF